jgi:hypothetical protein
MAKNIAYFNLGLPVLMEALGLPEGTDIRRVDWDHTVDALRVTVEHPDLPLTREGFAVMQITPVMTREYGELMTLWPPLQ